jgi:hypothetical protein
MADEINENTTKSTANIIAIGTELLNLCDTDVSYNNGAKQIIAVRNLRSKLKNASDEVINIDDKEYTQINFGLQFAAKLFEILRNYQPIGDQTGGQNG